MQIANFYTEETQEQPTQVSPAMDLRDIFFTQEFQEEQEPTEPQVTEQVIEPSAPDEAVQETVHPYPSYLGEEWVPPSEATVDWYKEKYRQVIEFANTDEFLDKVQSNYSDALLKTYEETEKVKEVYQALKTGNTLPLRMYFPDKLAELGIEPMLSEDEISNTIEAHLKQEFGDTYSDIYNERDVIKPNSPSAKIFNRSQVLYNHYLNENTKREQAYNDYKTRVQQPQEEVPFNPDDYYTEVATEMDRPTFDAALNTIKEKLQQWNFKDLHRFVNYETNLALAKEQSYKEGREAAIAEIKGIGNAKPITRADLSERQEQPVKHNQSVSWHDILSKAF